MTWARYLLVLGAVVYASANAGQPPTTVQTPPSGSDSSATAPDEGLIEFLGADDVGDAAWWEFFKKAPPPRGKDTPPATPPQDAKQ